MSPQKFARLKEMNEQAIPYNRALGLELLEAGDGKARMRFDFSANLVGNFKMNILHGGAISTVLDVVGACAVLAAFPDDAPLYGMGTVDLRVDFLQPGAGEYFVATGQVMRPGRILASTRMELMNDKDELVAMGTAIYRVSKKEESAMMNV